MRGSMKEKSRSGTMRFLIFSIIFVTVLCVCTFSFLAIYMNHKATETLKKMGTIYMASVSEQISRHFETAISLRMGQAEDLVDTVKSNNAKDAAQLYRTLTYDARVRDFDYLAFYMEDGSVDVVYGEHTDVYGLQLFVDSLKRGERKLALGSNEQEEHSLLLGIPIQYSMEGGRECIALVAGISTEYLTDTLALEENDQKVYSFIIRKDGSYVIRTSDEYRDNYFDRVNSVYEDIDGKSTGQYLTELKAAMEANEDYSSEFQIYGERRHLYGTSLESSEWYLLTFMPYDVLNKTIRDFSSQWVLLALGYCALIMSTLLWLFFRYFRMMKKQIIALEDAWEKAEEAKQAAERASKAKSEFLSNMSHDIRTPMNAIVGLTVIASSNIDNKQSVQECLKKITTSSKHLLGIINDVLDMAKIESGKMTLNQESVSLRETMDGLVSIVQQQVRAKKQSFDVIIRDISTEHVCTDGVRLNQILLNLLSNAVKFTPEGGSIQVTVYEEASLKSEDYVRVHFLVKDNGIGMSPEFKEHVFESFEREDSGRVHRTEGTGLGMAICKYIVDAMDGEITVESEQGKGTEFHVVLDLLKEEISETDMVLPKEFDLSGRRILLAEDLELNWEVARELLSGLGLELDWAENGQICLEKFEHSEEGYYDAILMDVRMPVMGGYEAARAIRALNRADAGRIPIIAMTADAFSEDIQKSLEAGMNAHTAKPIDIQEVAKLLEKYIG